MSDRTRKVILIIGVVIMLVGLGGILYPFVGEWINHGRYVRDVDDYRSQVDSMGDAKSQELLQGAYAYNDALFERTGGVISELTQEQRAAYDAALNMSATTIMGYIDLPKIGETLPIYHGTSEAVLQEGVGHLEGSSLPVGGASTHTVLTGHAGLPSKKIFTNLDQLEIGDTFTLTVLGRELTYQVDEIEVKLPEDVLLSVDQGADQCTLVTCTPIGANTHRLLVHALRVEDGAGAETPAEPDRLGAGFYIGVALAVLAAAGVIGFFVYYKKVRRNGRR